MASQNLPPETLSKIKGMIREHLEKSSVFDNLKDTITKESFDRLVDQEKILQTIKKEKIVENIMGDLKLSPDVTRKVHRQRKERSVEDYVKANKRLIHLKLVTGKAFVEYISSRENAHFIVDVKFQDQRFVSKPVSCCEEPIFGESFLLVLNPTETNSKIELTDFARLTAPIHISVLKESPDGSRQLLSTKRLEWRILLSNGSVTLNVELSGVGNKSKLSVGVLELQLDLLPKVTRLELVPDNVVSDRLSREQKYENDGIHTFYEYSEDWWKDYKQIRPSHESRLIKIFCENEEGLFRPVSSMVRPLQANRVIESPFHAARFVSLIPYHKNEGPGGTRNEIWYSLHTFLAKRYGDSQEHAMLLCSLLLGFGQEAYVCVGTSGEGAHTWVMTKVRDNSAESGHFKVTFWESVTGQRLESDDPRVHRYYRKIGCIFNHEEFYGNIQADDTVINTNFDLTDESMWKPMARECLENLVPENSSVPLFSPTMICQEEEEEIELQLKRRIAEYRDREGLGTMWDRNLSYLLTPALVNYELDKLGAKTFGNAEFQHSIKNAVPEGHTFKGFPIQFQHLNSEKMMISLEKAATAADILNSRGDQVRFALRARIIVYAENFTAVWVMLAVRYRSTDN